jgi:hypothetical protein
MSAVSDPEIKRKQKKFLFNVRPRNLACCLCLRYFFLHFLLRCYSRFGFSKRNCVMTPYVDLMERVNVLMFCYLCVFYYLNNITLLTSGCIMYLVFVHHIRREVMSELEAFWKVTLERAEKQRYETMLVMINERKKKAEEELQEWRKELSTHQPTAAKMNEFLQPRTSTNNYNILCNTNCSKSGRTNLHC